MGTGIYTQRKPEKTALYQVVRDHYSRFHLSYNEKYAQEYGFFRTEIEREIEKFRKCGIFKHGFARVRCQRDGCGEEFLLPFSCHGRGVCPSCITKYALELEQLLTDEIIKEVPHRHLILTIPKRLRKNFLWHRECLNDLSRMAWRVIREFMRSTLEVDGVPGAVQSIETCGQYLDINPHVHVIATDGLFTEDGVFYKMPPYSEGSQIYFKSLWEMAVARYVIGKGFITEGLMMKMLHWDYTGFSVYTETRIDYKRTDLKSDEALRHIIRYIAKPPIAEGNLTYQGGTVLYKGNYHKGKKQNFVTFKPSDFLAAYTSHIPKHRQKYINYYGVFSSKTRGYNKKHGSKMDEKYPVMCPEITIEQRKFRRTWAALIRKVWEVDPLKCKKCGHEMKVISVITEHAVIKRILEHLGLWSDRTGRGPPIAVEQKLPDEIEYVPDEYAWS